MDAPAEHRIALWRGLALALAAFAIGLRLVVPAGFMVRSEPGLPFAVTLCTADGQLAAPHKAPDDRTDEHRDLCPFAGAISAPPPPLAILTRGEAPAYAEPPAPAALGLTPGRGLAAPPPPARGPPTLLS